MPATIRLGSTGADVTTWQGLLTSAGFPVASTGVFDQPTDAATKQWQAAKGLAIDGVVGPASWGAMTGSGGSYEQTPTIDVATDIAAVPGLAENTDNAFRYALAKMAARLRTNPDYIAAAMAVETGKKFTAYAENPLSHAIGLIQFMPNPGGSASRLTGLTSGTGTGSGFELLKNLSPIEQLEYVEKYFKPFAGKMNNPTDAYLAVFWPSAMGKSADYVIAEEGTKVYEQNKGFDTAKKGSITAGDVGAAAQYMLNQAAKKPRIPITPEGPPDTGYGVRMPEELSAVPKVGLIALFVTGAYFLWRWSRGR